MYLKALAYISALLLVFPFYSCDNNMDVITTCPVVIHNDSRYQNSIHDASTEVKDVWLENNCLNLRLSYSGGCNDHNIELISPVLKNLSISTREKNEITLEIYHVNEDPCESIVSQQYGFDISDFKEFASEWRISFSNSTKVIDVKF